MFSENNKISGRQIFRLLSYDLIGISTLLLPPMLAAYAGADGVFCIAAGTIAALGYVKLLSHVLKSMKTDFGAWIRNRCGKIAEKCVLLFYFLYFALFASLVASFFVRLVLANLLKEESYGLVLVLLLLLAGYGVYCGIEGRARVYEMLFWFLFLPLLAMLLGAVKMVDTDFWTPVGMASADSFCKGSYLVFFFESLSFLLVFFFPYAAKKEALARNATRAVLFSGGLNMVLYLILLGVFGSVALSAMKYPAVTLMSIVQISGGFLKRTDAFMFGVWFFTLYALLNSFLFYGMKTAKELVGKGRENDYLPAVLLFSAGLALYGYQNECWQEKAAWFLAAAGTPAAVFCPVILALVPQRRRKENR